MPSGTNAAISRVIDSMRQRLGEPFRIDEMADLAQFSKFHFSRIFQEATGLPPARFLTAVRLSEAKRLLLTTSLTVTEIGIRVGYTSSSSFSSRFKNSVTMAPLPYRERGGIRPLSERPERTPSPEGATVRGRVLLPPEVDPGPLYLGLFPAPICDGDPVACTAISAPDEFKMCDVPPGTWHLLGYLSDPPEVKRLSDNRFRAMEPEWRCASEPLRLSADTTFVVRPLTFHRPRPTEPPILTAPWEHRPTGPPLAQFSSTPSPQPSTG